MPETKTKEKTPQTQQTQKQTKEHSSPFIPDRTIQRRRLARAEEKEEKKK